ncbi:MAG: helix-turn-helix transcriptional regulator [Sphaerochaetaceae bacterium]|nr:helix-turn-helix transcriptional regulator [Sphaerochaetaceae bacterium]
MKDIAILLGMDYDYYSRIEKGQYKMSLKMLLRICRMLWIDVKVEPTGNPYSGGTVRLKEKPSGDGTKNLRPF